jgi:exonuclease III
MIHKIVLWNVGVLNKREKRLMVRGLLKDWKAYIICLQEIKMEYIYREVICSLW